MVLNIVNNINIIITILILVIGGIIKYITYRKIKNLDGFLGIIPKNKHPKDDKVNK